MQTVLTRNEITKKSVTKFFKYILDYDFKRCNCYKYLIFSGAYDFCFLDKSIIISFTNNLKTAIYIGYKDINHIEIDIGEDDNLYLVIECINGLSIALKDNEQIKFSEEVKAELYGN